MPQTTVVTLALLALFSASTLTAPAEVTLSEPDVFPESISSTVNGTLYVGSLPRPFISRALPGETVAKPWIRFTGEQSGSTLGVLADMAQGLLWACVIE